MHVFVADCDEWGIGGMSGVGATRVRKKKGQDGDEKSPLKKKKGEEGDENAPQQNRGEPRKKRRQDAGAVANGWGSMSSSEARLRWEVLHLTFRTLRKLGCGTQDWARV